MLVFAAVVEINNLNYLKLIKKQNFILQFFPTDLANVGVPSFRNCQLANGRRRLVLPTNGIQAILNFIIGGDILKFELHLFFDLFRNY